jgi:lysophospholipase L1-like esterase
MRRIVVLLAAFLTFSLVLAEISLRLWECAHERTGSLYDSVVVTGSRFKLRPSSTVLVPEKHGYIRYRFNRAGYRDDDPDPRFPGRRLVILGDSVSFGLGVDQDRIYPSLLERHLARRLREPYEVVSLAVFAYDTRDELEAFRTDGAILAPALTILQFYMNDFSVAEDSHAVFSPLARFRAFKNRHFSSSALYRRLYPVAKRATDRLSRHPRQSHRPATLDVTEAESMLDYLARYPDDESVTAFRAIREIHDAATRGGSRFLLFVSPDAAQLSTTKYDRINERIHRFCRSRGIEVFDPLSALRARPDRGALFSDGAHLSPRGHEVMAMLLADLTARRPARDR